MNVLTRLIAAAKDEAIRDLDHGESNTGTSTPISLRDGDTLFFVAKRGPRGGVTIQRRRVCGWVLDHPADFGEASY